MKIIKLIKNDHGHYYVIFDETPEMTYEKIGSSYVGSSTDENGNIIQSNFLKYEYSSYSKAFAGRELTLEMKDGTTQKIKDHWWDCGSYKPHGEFIGIGAGTLESLQRCYVYFSMNINHKTFLGMVEEYLSREKLYGYWEVEDWCKLQYTWYNVIVNGKKIPYMMNEYGDMVEKETKKRVYPRRNVCRKINGKWKEYTYFVFEYKEPGRLIKIEANYLNTLKATLPLSEEEILKNCKMNKYC